jgi:UDP-N-acetyl-D-galactosamine dehydrogenase
MNHSDRKLAIVGLGYVGLPLAVEFAKHRKVIGFDIKPGRVAELAAGKDSTREISAEELAQASGLVLTSDAALLADCDTFIVTVPTPINDANRPDLRPLVGASQTLAQRLRPGAVVIYESTVYPGCTEEVCVPVLEAGSGLTYNKDFFCGYSPERINPGDKIHTLTRIRKVTSGSTHEVAALVDALYASIIEAGTYRAASIAVAEAAKVIENTQRDLNIALINELSLIFEKLGLDTSDVLEAAGTKWNFLPFRPGMVGGHCIGVDPYYLTHKAEQVGYLPQVILAGRRINDSMAGHAARQVVKRMLNNGIDVAHCVVGVMGVTFKENCPDIRNSKVVDLIRELQDWGVKVRVMDPWADAADLHHETGITLETIDPSAQVDALVVAVAHKEFRALTESTLRSLVRGDKPVLADLKGLYDRYALAKVGFSVFRL